MTLEIRPCREEEMDAFDRVPSIVFGNYTGQPRAADAPRVIPPDWSLCAFEDGVLATTYAAYPFTMRLNGAKATAAGVTAVGTLPWYRRRGHLRKIMETDFQRRYEQRMEPLAVLLASIAGIYQRYGYAICSSRNRYTIDPRWINFAPSVPAATGTWREASKDELPLLQSMYREFSAPRNGYLHRAPIIWEGQVLATVQAGGFSSPGGPSVLAVYEEGGEPLAYVAHGAMWLADAQDRAGPGQRLYVRDLVWKTPGAYRAIWEYFKKFDLAVRVVIESAPTDDPAFDILLDPRELNATRFDHLLGRIIDIERALPARRYTIDGRAVIAVRDAMCPWNADTWALECGKDGAQISRSKESPQLSLDISALVQLMFGQLSPSLSVRYGRAEASRDADLPALDALFATEYAPHCPDGF